jgi:hypothetical protein
MLIEKRKLLRHRSRKSREKSGSCTDDDTGERAGAREDCGTARA